MGTDVYAWDASGIESLHIYCHSRRDGQEGYAYLIINNSAEDFVAVELTQDTDCYMLTASTLRSPVMMLNEISLTADESGNISNIYPKVYLKGKITMPPCSIMFAVL
ncbi:MAG: hypothetical protein ACI3XF_01400 [Eubacteriales bacterium]